MSIPSSVSADRARTRRLVIIAILAIAVEIALALVAWRGPALAHLIYPVYYIVAIAAAASFWHAVRRRPHQDRRHGDRRHERV